MIFVMNASKQVSLCTPLFAQIIQEIDDEDTLSYALWGLSYLSTGDDNQIQEVYSFLDPKVVVRHSCDTHPEVKVPAWRLVGNLLSGNSTIAKVAATIIDLYLFADRNFWKMD